MADAGVRAMVNQGIEFSTEIERLEEQVTRKEAEIQQLREKIKETKIQLRQIEANLATLGQRPAWPSVG
jgi:SMC interacting uncharacterized protein involved in chromosome segregation